MVSGQQTRALNKQTQQLWCIVPAVVSTAFRHEPFLRITSFLM